MADLPATQLQMLDHLAEPLAVERKLAAILAADAVGYSRLMEADEAGTFTR
jgi:class 3 adenylate cyclase